MTDELKIGFLLFPHLTPLDLAGPAQVFATALRARLHYVWKNLDPVPSDAGISLMPTHSFRDCGPLDLICVPGGPGQGPLMKDPEVLEWLARQGAAADWITSVCSGSLLLGAAGLLNGHRAASHWHYREHLVHFGAVPDAGRVCQDRNRITGGGVTAGIDMALTVLAKVFGDEEAKQVQLILEYAPQPPFDCGRPESAGAALVSAARRRLEDQRKLAEEALA